MYTLYVAAGEYRDRQTLSPVISEQESTLLKRLFEMLKDDVTLTVIDDSGDCLVGFTLRSISHDRKYVAELITEITGKLKFSI